ncbi:MAG: flagellar hook-length control protein FliK [Pseudomonadota bacterium]|jgi:flagellar hook-length control protein FliK
MQSLPVSAAIAPAPAANAGSAAGSSVPAELSGQADGVFSEMLEQQIKGMEMSLRFRPDELPFAAAKGAVKEDDTDAAVGQLEPDIVEAVVAPDLRGLVAAAAPVLIGEAQPSPASDTHPGEKRSPDIEIATATDQRGEAAQIAPLLAGVVQPASPSGKSAADPMMAAGVGGNRSDSAVVSSPLAATDDRAPQKPGEALAAGKGLAAAEFAAGGNMLPRDAAEKTEAKPVAAMADPNPARFTADAPGAGSRSDIAAAPPLPATASPVSSPSRAMTVEPAVGAAAWGDALGQKVVWLASQNQQVAELHLNPPSLGPLEVRLSISNDQASALFVSHHPAVRDAIESAMPRLRDMLADNGIMLGNATVSAESFTRQQAFQQEAGQSSRQDAAPFVLAGDNIQAVRGITAFRSGGNGLVDTFA